MLYVYVEYVFEGLKLVKLILYLLVLKCWVEDLIFDLYGFIEGM